MKSRREKRHGRMHDGDVNYIFVLYLHDKNLKEDYKIKA